MSGFFPSFLFSPDDAATWYSEPSLGNPATVAIAVNGGGWEVLPADIIGTFTLALDSQTIVSARPMLKEANYTATGNLREIVFHGSISGVELAVQGWYQWQATISSISEDFTLTLEGDFSL